MLRESRKFLLFKEWPGIGGGSSDNSLKLSPELPNVVAKLFKVK